MTAARTAGSAAVCRSISIEKVFDIFRKNQVKGNLTRAIFRGFQFNIVLNVSVKVIRHNCTAHNLWRACVHAHIENMADLP